MNVVQFNTGFITELETAKYFSEQGWEIYWPLMTQSRADFIIAREKEYYKVQCKKATWSKTGPHWYAQCRLTNRNKTPNPKYELKDFDKLVVADGHGSIWLVPIEEIMGMTSLCFLSTNPKYKRQTKYDPDNWLVQKGSFIGT